MGKKEKILIGIFVVLMLFILINSITYYLTADNWTDTDSAKIRMIQHFEERAEKAERERITEIEENQKRLDDQIAVKEREQAELKKQEAERLENLKQLPVECDGVDSIETYLYPTGEECLELIDERIFAYCLDQSNNDEAKASVCFAQAYMLMDRNCRDSDDQGWLSYPYEVCVMMELKYAYEAMAPTS